MFELWMVWFAPLAIVLAGFVCGLVAYALGYDINPDYDEVTNHE